MIVLKYVILDASRRTRQMATGSPPGPTNHALQGGGRVQHHNIPLPAVVVQVCQTCSCICVRVCVLESRRPCPAPPEGPWSDVGMQAPCPTTTDFVRLRKAVSRGSSSHRACVCMRVGTSYVSGWMGGVSGPMQTSTSCSPAARATLPTRRAMPSLAREVRRQCSRRDLAGGETTSSGDTSP